VSLGVLFQQSSNQIADTMETQIELLIFMVEIIQLLVKTYHMEFAIIYRSRANVPLVTLW
jgi:hypothetical protein